MVYIDRIKEDENGTFGEMTADSVDLKDIYTVERPPTGEHPCIPVGTYDVEKFNSPKHGDIWMLQDVPGRTAIEFHPANNINDLLGCIGVGNSLGEVDGLPAVLNSQSTFKMLKSVLPDSFQLTITGVQNA